MENIANSRWKSFLVRFAIFFPIFLLSRILFGGGFIRFALAWWLTTWIDPVRRYKQRQKNEPERLKQIFR